jgi:hypothetical protein
LFLPTRIIGAKKTIAAIKRGKRLKNDSKKSLELRDVYITIEKAIIQKMQ